VTAEEEVTAQRRFLVLNLVRITGAIMLVIGLAVIGNGLFGLPEPVGYLLFLIGIADFIVVPLLLAKKWKSPTGP
jgi:hypothetical protein